MRYSRPVRIFFGLIILIVFGWYVGTRFSYGVMSNEVGGERRPAAAAQAQEVPPVQGRP